MHCVVDHKLHGLAAIAEAPRSVSLSIGRSATPGRVGALDDSLARKQIMSNRIKKVLCVRKESPLLHIALTNSTHFSPAVLIPQIPAIPQSVHMIH
jgi:hypothetical protein